MEPVLRTSAGATEPVLKNWAREIFINRSPEIPHNGVSRRGFDPTAYETTRAVMGLTRMSSFSAWALGMAQLPFIFNFFKSIWWGEKVSDNPWGATTLEWLAPSPPPHGNFTADPVCYRDPYDYSPVGATEDFIPQHMAKEA